MEREELTRLVRNAMDTGLVSCYSEAFERYEEEIRSMARRISSPTGFVMACIVDDIDAMLMDDEQEHPKDCGCDPGVLVCVKKAVAGTPLAFLPEYGDYS